MSQTLIQGTLALAGGMGPIVCSIKITNQAFVDVDGNFHPAGSVTYTPDPMTGNYSFPLSPTVGATPSGTTYSATWYIPGQNPYTEIWTVPETDLTWEIWKLRDNPVPAARGNLVQASQIFSGTANVGDALICLGPGSGFVPATLQSIHAFAFTQQETLTITQAQHGQGSALLVSVRDSTGTLVDPLINVDDIGNVTITFNEPTDGAGFVYGGLARSLPNWSKSYYNQQIVTVKQSDHRFNTPNLDVVLYDAYGNVMDASATIQLNSNFDVTVSFSSPQVFKIVIVGCLGVTIPAIGTGTGNTGGGGDTGGGTGTGGGGTVVATPVPYSTFVTGGEIIAGSLHAKGPAAIPRFFSTDTPAQAALANYTRSNIGDLAPDPSFSGTMEITSGNIQGESSAFVLPLYTATSLLTIPASLHGQGANPVVTAFTADNPPQAVLCGVSRDGSGDLTVDFSPPLMGSVQVSSSGPRGTSLFVLPITVPSTGVLVSAESHGKGAAAIAFFWTADTPSRQVLASYTRSAAGDMAITFEPPFTGTIEIIQPQ